MTAPGGASSRTVKVVIAADVASALRAFTQTEQGLRSVGQQAEQAAKKTSTMGDVLKGTLAASGIQAGITGIVGGLKNVVASGMEYERSQNQFQAVTQASADEMTRAAEVAQQLGSDIKLPGASAQTATAAMLSLAKGGLEANEAMDAARGTMTLAAAAGMDAAQAAEIQSGALKTFGLEANEAGRVANVLANVTNKSAGELSDFAMGMSQSGSVAHMMGMSIEDTTTALGLFANAGLRGSDGGTSLRQSLMMLMNPSEEAQKAIDQLGLTVWDAQGNFVGYRSIVEQLSAAKKTLTQQEFAQASAAIFGSDAVRAASIIADQGTESWDDMGAAIMNANGAQDMAAANSKGLSGVIDALKNTVDTASLALFEQLQPSIMQVAEAATGLVGPLAEGLAPALGAVADLATGTLAPAVTGLSGVLGAVVGPVSSLVSWLGELPSPIGMGVLALGGVIALRGPLTATFASWTASGGTLLATLRGTAGAAAAGSAGLAGWIASLRAATGAAATFGVVARGSLAVLGGPIGLAIIGVTTALSFMSSSTDEAAESTSDFSEAIDENTGALKDNAPAVIAKRLADQGQLTAAENAGLAIADYTRAVMEQGDALESVQAQLKATAVEQIKSGGNWEKLVGQAQRAKLATDEYLTSLLTSGDASRGAGLGIGELVGVYDAVTDEANRLATQQKQVNQANDAAAGVAEDAAGGIEKVGGAADKAEKAATPFADALKELRDSTSEADAATNYLISSLQLMTDGSISAAQMQRETEAAMRAVTGSARDVADAQAKAAEAQEHADFVASRLGKTLDGQAVSATNVAITQADVDAAYRSAADAADAVKDATDRQADSVDKLAQNAIDATGAVFGQSAAQGDMRAAVKDAIAEMESQRQRFIESQIEIGKTREEAEKLADQYNLVPLSVITRIKQEGGEAAQAAIYALRDEIDKLTTSPHIVKVAVESGDIVYTTANGQKMLAAGGFVTGPGGPTDDAIDARLSNGEYVVRASQTAKHRGLLDMINTPGFAEGGLVQAGPQRLTDILMQTTAVDLVNTGWRAAIDKAAMEKAKKFAESGMFGLRQAFLSAVASKMGTAYVWGAAGPDVFDCSGLMSWALQSIGAGVGRLTAEGFNTSFPHVGMPGKPGDLVTFDTGRLPGRAGHIGVIMDPGKGLMMHTDGAGPARVGDYLRRDGGPLSVVDVLTGKGGAVTGAALAAGMRGDLPDVGSGVGGVSQYADEVLRALALTGQPASYSRYVLHQMMTESSGNRFAVNNYDSNARRGTPSKGLMQVIDPTFRSYAMPGYNTDIFDPLSNILASIRYVLARYGSIPAGMRGVAYDRGGDLPPGFTLAYNGTGQTEHVSTARDWSAINAMAAQAIPARTEHTVRIEVSGEGALTDAMINTARVTVDGKLVDVARAVTTAGAQTR